MNFRKLMGQFEALLQMIVPHLRRKSSNYKDILTWSNNLGSLSEVGHLLLSWETDMKSVPDKRDRPMRLFPAQKFRKINLNQKRGLLLRSMKILYQQFEKILLLLCKLFPRKKNASGV